MGENGELWAKKNCERDKELWEKYGETMDCGKYKKLWENGGEVKNVRNIRNCGREGELGKRMENCESE